MSGRIVFPGAVPPSALLSATDQAGARSSGMIAGAGNAGAVSFAARGSFASSITPYAEITTGGNLRTAEFLASLDGGTTLLGRKVDTTWDGNGAANRTILTDTNTCACSRALPVDRDEDGITDRALIAVVRSSTTPDRIDILYTDDLTGVSAWSSLCSGATGADVPVVVSPALICKDGVLFLFCEIAGAAVVYKSLDYGVSWGSKVTIDSSSTGGFDAVILPSGRMVVVYTKLYTANYHPACKSSLNGASWTGTAKQITAAGSVTYTDPTIFYDDVSGKTISMFRRETATSAVQARQTTAADPATGTWAAYSETLFAGDTSDAGGTACVAPDGTIYFIGFEIAGDTFLEMSKFKAGDASYSSAATIFTIVSADLYYPRVACIGGAIWCAFVDNTNNDILLVLTKYITAYDVSTAPAIWTGPAPQFIGSGLWLTPSGSGGEVGDTFATTTTYEYGADRMLALRPTQPSRSIADGSAWNAVFYLGANKLVPIDTICGFFNGDHFHLQMNDSDSWTSPAVNTTVSFARQTIASGGYSVVAGKATINAGGLIPGSLVGQRCRFGALATGNNYLIRDNDASRIYIDADISGESGDLVIYSPRAWAIQTLATHPYIRVLIDAQQTAEGYYQLPVVLLGGPGIALADDVMRAPDGDIYPYEDDYTRAGNITRACPGEMRREYQLNIVGPSLAQWQELRARFKALGAKPVALIPNIADHYEWVLCYPAEKIRWNDPTRVTITLEESI